MSLETPKRAVQPAASTGPIGPPEPKRRVPFPLQRERLVETLHQHRIECTGLGEVSCAGCRDRGWMPTWTYEEHLADAILRAAGGVS